MRWVLIDEIIEIRKGRRALLRSHIPSSSVFPGFLVVEMMAQAGALLLGPESAFTENLVFAKIDSIKFGTPLYAGDSLEIEAWSDQLKGEGAWINVRAVKENGMAAEGSLLLMSAGNLLPGRKSSITFHENFMSHFRVREKVRYE